LRKRKIIRMDNRSDFRIGKMRDQILGTARRIEDMRIGVRLHIRCEVWMNGIVARRGIRKWSRRRRNVRRSGDEIFWHSGASRTICAARMIFNA